MTKTVLITGANRGIGLGFVRHYLEAGWQVEACARSESSELTAIREAHDNIKIHKLDVADHAAIERLAALYADGALDLLISNAGVYGERQNFGELDYSAWRRVLEVNTLAPVKLAECFADKMKSNGSLVFISSKVGSIGEADQDGLIYSTSKAALNMAVKRMGVVLKGRKVRTLALHPGSVMTDMNQNGSITVPESVEGMASVINDLSTGDSGSFQDWRGKALPW